jgi:hypothetical protein
MQRKSFLLLSLLVGISGWLLWANTPLGQDTTLARDRAVSPLSPQPTPLKIAANWPTFTHPTWGISFRYHPQWTATIPDLDALSTSFREEEEYIRTVGHVITLLPPKNSAWGNTKIEIMLFNYTLSPSGELERWVSQSSWRYQNGAPAPLKVRPLDEAYTPATADQALYAVGTGIGDPSNIIWIARRGLVYGIVMYDAEPGTIQLAQQIASSLIFDNHQQIRLRQSDVFIGDEEDLRASHETLLPPGNVSPLVTPAAIAPVSPLAQPLQRYDGHSLAPSTPPFEIQYDPALWQLTEGKTGMNYLIHRAIKNCSIDLLASPAEAILIASTTLAGYTWSVKQIDLYSFTYVTSHANWPQNDYLLKIIYPDPLPNSNLFFEVPESECRRQVTAILNTFVVLDQGWSWPVATPSSRD